MAGKSAVSQGAWQPRSDWTVWIDPDSGECYRPATREVPVDGSLQPHAPRPV